MPQSLPAQALNTPPFDSLQIGDRDKKELMFPDFETFDSNLLPTLDPEAARTLPIEHPFSPNTHLAADFQLFLNTASGGVNVIPPSDQVQLIENNSHTAVGTDLIRRSSAIFQFPNFGTSATPTNLDVDPLSHLFLKGTTSDMAGGFLKYLVRNRFGPR